MDLLEVVHNESHNATTRHPPQNDLAHSKVDLGQLACKFVKMEDAGFYPASEDDVMAVEQLLAEPQIQEDLNECMLYMNYEVPSNSVAVHDFSCTTDYSEQQIDWRMLNPYAASSGKMDLKQEFFYGTSQELDGRDINIPWKILNLYPDYLSDAGPSGISQIDYISDVPCMRIFNSEQRTKVLERAECNDDMSDMSNIANRTEATFEQDSAIIENMSIEELRHAFKSIFGRDTDAKDKQWLKCRLLFGLDSFTETNDDCDIAGCSLSPDDQDDELMRMLGGSFQGLCVPSSVASDINLSYRKEGEDMFYSQNAPVANLCKVDNMESQFSAIEEQQSNCSTTKRLRKQTCRYVDETSALVFKLNPTTSASKGSLVQMQNQVRARRGCRKRRTFLRPNKNTCKKQQTSLSLQLPSASPQFHDSECQNYMSDDCDMLTRGQKCRISKRSHWTLSEVMKLVEGVSQYGVGKWTEMKRSHFPTSARTSVNLKDKWRNLLRASGAQLHYKKVKPQKSILLPIPQSVLQRIRELSVVHPYPRDRKSEHDPSLSSSRTSIWCSDREVKKRTRTYVV